MIKQIKIPVIYEQHIFCDVCGGVMKHTGFVVKPNNPMRYLYHCQVCDAKASSSELYPKFFSGMENEATHVVQHQGYDLNPGRNTNG